MIFCFIRLKSPRIPDKYKRIIWNSALITFNNLSRMDQHHSALFNSFTLLIRPRKNAIHNFPYLRYLPSFSFFFLLRSLMVWFFSYYNILYCFFYFSSIFFSLSVSFSFFFFFYRLFLLHTYLPLLPLAPCLHFTQFEFSIRA